MFEPFLEWLYKQIIRDFDGLPAVVEIDYCEKAMGANSDLGLTRRGLSSPRIGHALPGRDFRDIRGWGALTEKAFSPSEGS